MYIATFMEKPPSSSLSCWAMSLSSSRSFFSLCFSLLYSSDLHIIIIIIIVIIIIIIIVNIITSRQSSSCSGVLMKELKIAQKKNINVGSLKRDK